MQPLIGYDDYDRARLAVREEEIEIVTLKETQILLGISDGNVKDNA